MPELAYLVWELQAVTHREALHLRRDAESPGFIRRATAGQLAATVVCLTLGLAGNAVGLVDLVGAEADRRLATAAQVRTAYIIFLCLEIGLLIFDAVFGCVTGSAWMRGRMGQERPNRREQRLQVCSVFVIIAFSCLADLPLTFLKFLFLHWTRFTSTEVPRYLLASALITTLAYTGKMLLGLVHYVWKQMTPRVDPLHEKAPVYFDASPLADSFLWGLAMLMPVVNMLFSIVVVCMAIMTTKLA